MGNIVDQLVTYLKASFPIIQVLSTETERAKEIVRNAVEKLNSILYKSDADEWLKTTGFLYVTWDVVNGIFIDGESRPTPGTTDPEAALRWVLRDLNKPAIIVLEGIEPWLSGHLGPVLCQYLIEIYRNIASRKHIVILSDRPVPQILRSYLVTVDLPLPTKEEIKETIIVFAKEVLGMKNPEKTLNIDLLANTCIGMNRIEVESALCVASVAKTSNEIDHRVLYEEKAKAVKKSGLLEILEVEPIEHIGGLENLKEWLKMISQVYRYPEKADKYHLPKLKGALVVGVPGTGKTLCAKAVASLFEVPLIRFDVGRLLGSLVGETERNTREAFSLIEALDKCVVIIDELEKALAGADSQGDSGVVSRFVGSLLYFMQEKKGSSFFVCTANDVTKLPPEITRKGRFDEMWYVSLPSEEDIQEIIKIHLRKVKRNPEKFDIRTIAKAMNGFTGAEVESCVKFALYRAFFSKREVTTEDILECSKEIVPFAKTHKEEIDKLESWAIERARFASKKDKYERTPKKVKTIK